MNVYGVCCFCILVLSQASKSPTLPIHAYGDEEHAEPDDGDDGDDDEDDFDVDDEEGQ